MWGCSARGAGATWPPVGPVTGTVVVSGTVVATVAPVSAEPAGAGVTAVVGVVGTRLVVGALVVGVLVVGVLVVGVLVVGVLVVGVLVVGVLVVGVLVVVSVVGDVVGEVVVDGAGATETRVRSVRP